MLSGAEWSGATVSFDCSSRSAVTGVHEGNVGAWIRSDC